MTRLKGVFPYQGGGGGVTTRPSCYPRPECIGLVDRTPTPSTQGFPGDILFPADAGSRRRPETLSTAASLSPSSIFRAVQKTLADAGITGARACGQTLRNTYAANLICLGFTDEELTNNLGLRRHLRAAHPARLDGLQDRNTRPRRRVLVRNRRSSNGPWPKRASCWPAVLGY